MYDFYVDDCISDHPIHHFRQIKYNIVRQGFICDNVSCGIIRIYHLACLHRWIWQENRVPYCHICREYPRT